MEIKDLQWFLQLIKSGSFTEAAQELEVSQPTLSRVIQKLEQDMETQLVTRTQTGVQITQSGTELRRRIEPILKELQDIKESIRSPSDRGIVRIGVTPMISVMFFAPLISDLRRKWPYIHFTWYENGTEAIRKKLAEGELDLGIGISSSSYEKVLQTVDLIEDQMVVYVRNDHPLAKKENVRFEDLKDEKFNIYGSSFAITQQVYSRCMAANFTPQINLESSRAYFLMQMSAHGEGICILPRPYGSLFIQNDMKMLPIENYRWKCTLIGSENAYVPQSVQIVKNYLEQSFQIIAKEIARYPERNPLQLPCIQHWTGPSVTSVNEASQ